MNIISINIGIAAIEQPIDDIEIHWDGKDRSSATLISSLKKNNDNCELFNSCVDGLESLILTNFQSGVDVGADDYVAGIKSAYEAIVNDAQQ